MQSNPNRSVVQWHAEAEVKDFRDDRGSFAVAVAATRMAMVFADAGLPGYPIVFANDAFLALTGYAREEVLGQSFNFLLANGSDAEAIRKVAEEFAKHDGSGSEIRYRRKDGTEFWADLFICPVRDADDEIVQYFASFIDLTKHKDAETRSRMLIDELNHRVKNILATVQAIVLQALRTATDPEVIRKSIESRLFALSRSHDLLTRENWQGAGLHDLISDALQPFVLAEGPEQRIVIAGENIRFPPKAALALGIVFNELATNAVKYGALANETGSILVAWKVNATLEGRRLILQWRERGGPAVAPPTRRGFGTKMIERGLAHELKGTVSLDYHEDGLQVTIDIPVPGPSND